MNERQPHGRDGVYIVVEKVLARGERLRDSWPVHGTTGYDALNAINGIFVSRHGLNELRRIYRSSPATGRARPIRCMRASAS